MFWKGNGTNIQKQFDKKWLKYLIIFEMVAQKTCSFKVLSLIVLLAVVNADIGNFNAIIFTDGNYTYVTTFDNGRQSKPGRFGKESNKGVSAVALGYMDEFFRVEGRTLLKTTFGLYNDTPILYYGLGSVKRIAHDPITDNIYVVGDFIRIDVCSQQLKYCFTLVRAPNHSRIEDVALYPEKGLMFYLVNGPEAGVWTAGMDGEDPEILLKNFDGFDFVLPYRIKVEAVLKRIYVFDEKAGWIGQINLDGSDAKIVARNVNATDFDVSGDEIFYSEGKFIKIFGKKEELPRNILKVVGNIGQKQIKSFAVSFTSKLEQKSPGTVANPCENSCQFCILSTSPQGYRCLLPTDPGATASYGNCREGEDENCFTAVTDDADTGKCSNGFFGCREGKFCIPKQYVCDGNADCPDSSDEDYGRSCGKNMKIKSNKEVPTAASAMILSRLNTITLGGLVVVLAQIFTRCN